MTFHSDLAALPDGSIVRWLRIEGDQTSEAVGILHRQDGETWVSPGGWDPMTINVITAPATVIRYGPHDGETATDEISGEVGHHLGPVFPPRTDADYRDRALTLVVRLASHLPSGTVFLTVAREFENYLRGDITDAARP